MKNLDEGKKTKVPKKKSTQDELYSKIRKPLSPRTKVIPDKTKYSRKKFKKFEEELDNIFNDGKQS